MTSRKEGRWLKGRAKGLMYCTVGQHFVEDVDVWRYFVTPTLFTACACDRCATKAAA